MSIRSLALFLLVLAYSSVTVLGCGCTGCTQQVVLSNSNPFTLFSSSCPVDQLAGLVRLAIESTNSAQFSVFTRDNPTSSTNYALASTTDTTVTCFEDPWKSSGLDLVGGGSRNISVVVACASPSGCTLNYNISALCDGE